MAPNSRHPGIVSLRPTGTRLLLIEVAEQEFAVHGYKGPSVRSIAQLAGVKADAVY